MGKAESKIDEVNMKTHERLGIIKILPRTLKNIEQNRFLLKRQVESLLLKQQWEKQLRKIDDENTRQVLYLPLAYRFHQAGLCGNSGILELEFEDFHYALKSQIMSRSYSKKIFEETQLWYLLYNLIEAGFIFETRKKKLGDFHPNNILVNEKGRIKILPICALPNELNNYQRIVQSQLSDVFLAPEEIDELFIEKGVYPNIDPCRAEVFSIGVTILMAATLFNCYELYDRGHLKLNHVKLSILLKEVQNKFSKYFFDVVSSLLEEQPKRRRSCEALFNELNKYEDQILSLKYFDKEKPSLSVFNTSQDLETSIINYLPPQSGKSGGLYTPQNSRPNLYTNSR